MYVYLTKKIMLINNKKINYIAWNKEDGYIAVGGEGGLVRVIKLVAGNIYAKAIDPNDPTKSSNLSLQQTLEGHSADIHAITWNEKHQKLTTSDRNGIVIIWMLENDKWFGNIVNNTGKSTVVGIPWSTDQSRLCITHEDGTIIVQSPNRFKVLEKKIKSAPLSKAHWSPNGRLLLFGLKTGEVHLYDYFGNCGVPIEIMCLKTFIVPAKLRIVGIDWYNDKYGHIDPSSPNLAICYENGYVMLMRNENDPDPVFIETRMTAVYSTWNHNGSVLAIVGKQPRDGKSRNVLQLYDAFGEHLHTLMLPGENVTSCAWEKGSLRIAIGIDACIYFANTRPDYKWCYFKNTIVYSSCLVQQDGVCVFFWDLGTNKCHVLRVPVLLALAAYGEHCVLVTRSDTYHPLDPYGLLVCNTFGATIDRKYTDIEVKWVTINSTYVIAASKTDYLLWQYTTAKSTITNCSNYTPTEACLVKKDCKKVVTTAEGVTKEFHDPICCITASDKYLFIGKKSGLLKQYTMPGMGIVNISTLPITPHQMSVNCNSTRLSVIDTAGVLIVIDITLLAFELKDTANSRLKCTDVWTMCWASDSPELLAVVEKTKTYIYRGIHPEEPISNAGYIYSFANLEVRAVLLNEVMETPEKPAKEHLLKFEAKDLRDACELLENFTIKAAAQFIKENPHPRLWQLLGEEALKDLNLCMAEEAFIRCSNYCGIQFTKKLQCMTSNAIKRASVAAYLKNFDEAEKLYTEKERCDLALNLRKTLGDWFRVVQIIKMGVFAPDRLLKAVYNRIADYFTRINNWSSALEYYVLAKNKEKVIEAYYHLHDYESLKSIMEQLKDEDPLLKNIAKILTVEGEYGAAIQAYVKLHDLNTALHVSVLHHRWDQALYIAKKYHLHDVSRLFVDYSELLIKTEKIPKALEINVQAKYWFIASKLATKSAYEESKKITAEPTTIKKMYVYAARLMELHKKEPNDGEHVDAFADANLLEEHWKGAEAYHFYMIGHRQLRNGLYHDAVCTLYKLLDYTSYIPPEDVYSPLAFAAYHDGAFGLCSKMFVKLSSLEQLSTDEKAEYEKLAVQIFSSQDPIDLEEQKKYVDCFNCHSSVPDWEARCPHCNAHFPICVRTGRIVMTVDSHHKVCSTCHHMVGESYLYLPKFCPLCHSLYETAV